MSRVWLLEDERGVVRQIRVAPALYEHRRRFRRGEIGKGMFGRRKSYTDEDVYLTAMRWREIEENSEPPPMPQGILEWVKENPENEAKLAKAFGIQRGFILASFSGDPNDLEAFFRDVILRTHNYGIFRRFGKGIYRTHTKLRKKMDANYFRGIEEGCKQVTTGENLYLKHLQTY